jgi:hypothetical protein
LYIMISRFSSSLLIIFLISVSLIPFTNLSLLKDNTTPEDFTDFAQVFSSKSILFDESHTSGGSDMWTPGNASLFGWLLDVYGYNCSTNWFSSLDSGILDDYDILCLFFPQIALTTGEVDAIHNFVASGGGLLLVGTDETTQWEYTPSHLNPVSEIYGIEFNKDSVLGISDRSKGHISEHDVTYSVSSFHSSCDQLRGCTLSVENPAKALATISDSDVLAVMDGGNSRVAAIGSAAPFIIYRHGRGWQADPNDHFQLSLNLIDWLAGNTPREVDPPDTAVIKIGNGPAIESSELDEYIAFNGVYHDHTTWSDGLDSPLDMLAQALYTGLDYFLVADHSYENPADNGINGALATRQIQQARGLDCPIFIGAELSSMPHTVGFPLSENIFTNDIQEAVDGIHAQNAIAILAHPTIGFPYAPVWEAFDDYGYDAFEVTCRGYFHCLGESCYFRPFIGSSDGHSVPNLDLVRVVAYVKDPTGPDGTISVHDLVDAVLDYRIVILDKYNGVVLGQGVWVDKFLDEWDDAENIIETARNQIETLESSGASLGLSRIYLEEAERFLEHWNPARAIRAAEDAISEFVVGFDIDVSLTDSGVFEPNDKVSILINLVNNHTYGVNLNVTPFIYTSIIPTVFEPYPHPPPAYQILHISPESSTLFMYNATSSNFGYTRGAINFKVFNISNAPAPFIIRIGGIISNISVEVETEGRESFVTIRLLTSRADSRYITSSKIIYEDGSGEQTKPLENYGDSYGIVLGPYTTGTNITYQIQITDVLGNSFTIDGGTYQIELEPLGPEIWLSAIIGIGLVGFLSVVIVIARRRRISEA